MSTAPRSTVPTWPPRLATLSLLLVALLPAVVTPAVPRAEAAVSDTPPAKLTDATIDRWLGTDGEGPAATTAFDLRAATWDGAHTVYLVEHGWPLVRALDLRTGHIRVVAGPFDMGLAPMLEDGTQSAWGPVTDVAIAPEGTLWVSHLRGISRVDADGTIRRVQYGFDREESMLMSLAFDPHGRLHVADTGTHRVWRLAPDGSRVRIAGYGSPGFGGDGGPATRAPLDHPSAIAFDAHGRLYIADQFNGRVRRVDADGTIRTVAGGGDEDPRCCPDGGVAATDVALEDPSGVAVAPDGTLHVSEIRGTVLAVDPSGVLTMTVGNGPHWTPDDEGTPAAGVSVVGAARVEALGDGRLLVVAGTRLFVIEEDLIRTLAGTGHRASFDPSDVASTLKLHAPRIAGPDRAGNLYIADDVWIFRVSPDRVVTVVAGSGVDPAYHWDAWPSFGDGGPALEAPIGPFDLAVAPDGTLYFPDSFTGTVRRVSPEGTIDTVVGSGEYGPAEQGALATDTPASMIWGVALGPDGTLYLAEPFGHRVLAVGSDRRVRVVAGTGQRGYAGDGGPATAALFTHPTAPAVAADGTLYIPDDTVLRKVAPDGTIATFSGPWRPGPVALDAGGRLLVVSTSDTLERWRAPDDGQRLAGTGESGFAGDGGPAVAAQLNRVGGVVAVSDGRILLADGPTIRVIAPGTDGIVVRHAGEDRIDTAVAISRSTWRRHHADVVVLARATDYADALVAAPMAVREAGPLLLTWPERLPSEVEVEIQRVLSGQGHVLIIGGTAAVSAEVERRLLDLGLPVQRIAGADRYETASLIAAREIRRAEAVGAMGPAAVLLATGDNYPDALAASSAAAHANAVVLLTVGDRLPAATRAFLDQHPDLTRYALGGPAADAVPDAIPVVGADRYETAAYVASTFFQSPAAMGVASGVNYPDALAGAARLGRLRGPLLLTRPDRLPISTGEIIESAQRVSRLDIYGGTSAVHDQVAEVLRGLVGDGP